MSVSKDQLIQFMEKPWLLKEQTIGGLKEIVDEFPYFQSAQLLYTYNLLAEANFRYSGYLKTCSIYATDRTVLYQLLQPKPSNDSSHKEVLSDESLSKDAVSLFELSEEKQITAAEFPQISTSESADTDMMDFDLLSFEQPDGQFQPEEPETIAADQVQSEANSLKKDEKVDLIEQFIKINPTIQPRNEISILQNDPSELKDEDENDNDEFITETLSRIYFKQGHYQKAIDSFKRLSLKFPEKSVYFAQQIEEIKKSLN